MKTDLPGTQKNSKMISGSKSQIWDLILSLQEDPQFPREAITGTAAEKEAIRERNKLVERRERKCINEHTNHFLQIS